MDQSTHSSANGAAASRPEGGDPEIRGDPRMNRAVQAKLDNPHISLSEALDMGGFEYPPKATASAVDNENVTLGQRKNQLNRRLRQARLNQAAAVERTTIGGQMTMGNNGMTGISNQNNTSGNSLAAGSKRPSTAFSVSSSMTAPHDNKRQAVSSHNTNNNNGYQDNAIQQSLVTSQAMVPSEAALASLANFTQSLELLSNPGGSGQAHATFQATAPSTLNANSNFSAVNNNQAPQLLEQLLHMQSLQQPPPAHMVQPPQQQQQQQQQHNQQQHQQLANAASDLLQQHQQQQQVQHVANAASGLLQQQQQNQQTANAASDLLQQLAKFQQQQQQQQQPQQQNFVLQQQPQPQQQQQTMLAGQGQHQGIFGQQQSMLGQQQSASAPAQPQFALTTSTQQPGAFMGSNQGNTINFNSNDLSQMLFHTLPLQQQQQQQQQPNPSNTTVNNNMNGNVNNAAHSVTASHTSTMSSRNSATSSAACSSSGEADNHGGMSLTSQGVVSSSTTNTMAPLNQSAANFKALGGDAAAFLAAASLFQIPNGGENDLESDGRLKIGLEVFESEIRKLYQRSMIQAGYSLNEAQESSDAYHTFAFQAWRRECQTLQQVLLSRSSGSNGSTGHATQSNTTNTRSHAGGNVLNPPSMGPAGNNTLYAALPPASSNQQSGNNNNSNSSNGGTAAV